ncbi:aldehyde dehydrogenase family protein [Actinocrispum wychmicini]|uniref:Acyl-CoA reductase-like NAD-dependent aldehyde dehydrogenase n=1 Tax=Actinocrispum wychmicini TaxID=1213861 RepID=A0A4R2JP18_9PSEU|nr:aldehyde dehydrogenase family protein [Actinocrispum wychmicini]TCO61891.1 acyl-CoA reductase-like NAD-dependent aldehyde dehydrogenase [Actinocrispum wychmicini]
MVNKELPVLNPATGEVFATVATSAAEDVTRAVRAATLAAPAWRELGEDSRRDRLRACEKALDAHIPELAELLTREQGKPLADASAEVTLAAEWFGHTAALRVPSESLVAEPAAEIDLSRPPYGTVAAIAPSNYPVLLAVTKIAPALLAGNTVVLKPSPVTPLSSLRMVELLANVLPADVLGIVIGAGDVGQALVGDPAVQVVSFTGSIHTGRLIARSVAGDFKKVILELGGNDACIVLPGTDISRIAPGIFRRAMVNSGQFCAAIKRVYVHQADYGDLVDALASEARRAVVGDGDAPVTDLGPLAEHAQLERVSGLVTAARQAGGRAVTGGAKLDRPGYFYPPTVMDRLPPGTEVEVTEQFGPVLPVLAYTDVDVAIRRANDTEYGLGGSVWGDEAEAAAVAASLDCGTAWVNTHGDLRSNVPFGGFRSSGIGVEYGYYGLLEYTRMRVRSLAR